MLCLLKYSNGKLRKSLTTKDIRVLAVLGILVFPTFSLTMSNQRMNKPEIKIQIPKDSNNTSHIQQLYGLKSTHARLIPKVFYIDLLCHEATSLLDLKWMKENWSALWKHEQIPSRFDVTWKGMFPKLLIPSDWSSEHPPLWTVFSARIKLSSQL